MSDEVAPLDPKPHRSSTLSWLSALKNIKRTALPETMGTDIEENGSNNKSKVSAVPIECPVSVKEEDCFLKLTALGSNISSNKTNELSDDNNNNAVKIAGEINNIIEEKTLCSSDGSHETNEETSDSNEDDHVDETIYDYNFFETKKKDCDHSEESVDKAVYNYSYYEPKKQEDDAADMTQCDDESSETNLLVDNWYEESGYADYMLEDYVEVEGKYYKADCLPQTEEKKDESKDDFLYTENKSQVLYEWSRVFESDEDRNEIYDKWMYDLVTWERNRLVWLDQTGLIEGFDPAGDNDRTFLVKVETNKSFPESQGTCSLNADNATSTDAGDYWEAWYRLERLQRHKHLQEMGLPNWYDDLLQAENNEDVEASSVGMDKTKEQVPRNVNVTSESCLKDQEKDELKSLLIDIPNDLVCVYQFTNRNLWRKYHGNFKQGKYSE